MTPLTLEVADALTDAAIAHAEKIGGRFAISVLGGIGAGGGTAAEDHDVATTAVAALFLS